MSLTDADTQKDKKELIDIVDDNDVVIGTMPRSQAYAENQRKRIVYVFAVDPATYEIALAVRGKTVSWRPLHYSATVGGHVTAGETAEESAKREMQEEVGLDAALFPIAKYASLDPTNGYKSIDNIFVTFAKATELVLDPIEVGRVESMTLDAAREFAMNDDALLHPKLREQLDILSDNWPRILRQFS